MQLELFFNFDGDCREAVNFYGKVFKAEVNNIMTYADAPPTPGYDLAEADKNRIMYAGLKFNNMEAMFMDLPAGSPYIKGNNISPTLSTEDKEEVKRLFEELGEGGKIESELQQTFFSQLYGAVTDKFGITWQILYFSRENS
ncbi:MAG: VOC family protein [Anaerovoracaceae bacterium]